MTPHGVSLLSESKLEDTIILQSQEIMPIELGSWH
jgi:hypothetical protein